MAKTIAKTLDAKEMWKLVEAFKLEPDLVFECGITPEKFHILIASCAEVALAALVALSSSPKKIE